MCERGEEITLSPSFRNLADKPSRPVALRMDRFPISFEITSSLTGEKMKASDFTPLFW